MVLTLQKYYHTYLCPTEHTFTAGERASSNTKTDREYLWVMTNSDMEMLHSAAAS